APYSALSAPRGRGLVEASREARAGGFHALAAERRFGVLEVGLGEPGMRGDAHQVERGRARPAVELDHEEHVRELRLHVHAPRAVLLLVLEIVEVELDAA